ncbi:MAG TPA: VCBS repeat-containing protein [Planctomycetota bacterium]|nr:VCBS repeat-containing protein [Planctomycetota bacterium]
MRKLAIGALFLVAPAICAGSSPNESKPGAVPSSYIPYELYELVLEADIVVGGEIVSLDAKDFVLRIERRIVGEIAEPTLRVRRFVNWTCAWRWEPYAVGQRVVLFLERPTKGDTTPCILGAGGEGEMPLDADIVKLQTSPLSGGAEPTSAASRWRVSLDDLERATRTLRDEISWTRSATDDWGLQDLHPRTSIENLEAFARTSRLANCLSIEVRSSRKWLGRRSSPGRQIEPDRLRALDVPSSNSNSPVRGFAVSPTPIGDLDGDGNEDLACVESGKLALLFTDQVGAIRERRDVRDADESQSTTWRESLPRATALVTVSTGDAKKGIDLVLGSTPRAVETPDLGALWFLHLDRSGTIQNSHEILTAESLRPMRRVERGGLGRALAALGDLDGDGNRNLAISAHPTLEPDSANAVYFASLDSNGKLVSTNYILRNGLRSSGDGALATVGDVDGNGVADLAIGLPEVTPDHFLRTKGGATYAERGGAVSIALMSANAEAQSRRKITLAREGFVGDLASGDEFGRSLCAPGDLDGNGVPDLLVGSVTGVWTLFLGRDGTVENHKKLEDGPRDVDDAVHFGDSLTVLRPSAPGEPISILCGGTKGRGERATPVLWMLTVGSDGVLRAR